ncbi:hypothetical protein [Deinococcus peraridilitoris]|uniref:Uncharacterized protein n=1 Tax=Deinococcus peraridilitoris (strain DSM 19664 / LMG 22246 / CIP 109416 / KR-200) TaxID=937777 RepID=K9ZZB7_DEIPD|nr:hypothetical protein [Deinococcus peraridilitoris]AFZ66988.1 hypothetical protein Deipe_1447 [Deinococcus peraridilitoris DSM 19664]
MAKQLFLAAWLLSINGTDVQPGQIVSLDLSKEEESALVGEGKVLSKVKSDLPSNFVARSKVIEAGFPLLEQLEGKTPEDLVEAGLDEASAAKVVDAAAKLLANQE